MPRRSCDEQLVRLWGKYRHDCDEESIAMAKYNGPIVITGMGAVSPFGLGVEAFWSALQQGERRATTLEQGEPDDQPVLGLQVGELQLANLLGKRGLQYLRPSTQFLL